MASESITPLFTVMGNAVPETVSETFATDRSASKQPLPFAVTPVTIAAGYSALQPPPGNLTEASQTIVNDRNGVLTLSVDPDVATTDGRLNLDFHRLGWIAAAGVIPSQQIPAQTPIGTDTIAVPPAELQFLNRGLEQLENELGIIGNRVLAPYNVTVGVASEPFNSTARYILDPETNQATIVLNPRDLQDFMRLEKQQPGLGLMVYKSVLVNEIFGIAYAVQDPDSAARPATQTVELKSNEASIKYLSRVHADSPYLSQVLKLYQDNSAQIRNGEGPYAGRSVGTREQAKIADQVIRAMGLSGAIKH